MSSQLDVRRLVSGEAALFHQLNALFAAAFGEVDAYQAARPASVYLEQLLQKPHIIRWSHSRTARSWAVLLPTSSTSSSRSGAKSTFTIPRSKKIFAARAWRRHSLHTSATSPGSAAPG